LAGAALVAGKEGAGAGATVGWDFSVSGVAADTAEGTGNGVLGVAGCAGVKGGGDCVNSSNSAFKNHFLPTPDQVALRLAQRPLRFLGILKQILRFFSWNRYPIQYRPVKGRSISVASAFVGTPPIKRVGFLA